MKHVQKLKFFCFHNFPLDHDLSVITKHLRAEYNRRCLLKPLLWENTFKLPLDDVYTKLSIVSRRITDFRLEDRTVNMFDIFKTLNKGDDSMVLVEGSPGIGKTTFCLKISHDWANQKIPSESAFPVFKLLLLLKCRDICGDVIDAIVDQLLPMEGKVKEKLVDYIKDVHNQENILVILDGLDELPAAGECHVDKLLRRRMLPLCYVLATSRQEKGIEVRHEVYFDVLLQIEGFTEVDSFEYIRKHFSHLGLDHVAKGERLIQSILENTFLHALPSNPLNLLLLCVVFEDYEGNLPSSRTELYHIIVRCLLRRYCAKNNVKAASDDKAPEEQFKDSLLALGQLAWRCLQNDRFSFQEEELAELESKMKTLAARKLGLVFKEASAKKINPQHEYHFFHKTFQEYLAALYLAHKLLEEKVNVFHDLKLSFADITRKYNQVFIFVSGILGEATCNLFRQIGENLKVECWNWLKCTMQEATFFTECFSESGEAEQMAMTLCSFIPFPQTVTRCIGNDIFEGVLRVANACKSFSQLQLPVHLSVYFDDILHLRSADEFLTSYSRLETIFFSFEGVTEQITGLIYSALQVKSSLHSFTLQTSSCFSPKEAASIGDNLAANKTLQTVTLKLPGELGEHWATVLEKGLSGDTPLTSVVLEISGSVRKSDMVALNNLLLNRSLQSFGLTIYGDMHDSLATSVAEGLAANPYLKSLTLTVCGSVSCSAFISLKKGVVENSTLRSLVLKVFGGLPENWINICEALYVAKKSSLSLTIEPDVVSKITTSQVACLRPLLLEEKLGVLKLHSLTVKMWGELSCTGASDLCKLLIASRVSCVNLSIHGRVTDGVATCLVKNFDKVKTQSNLSINIRGGVTRDGKSTLEALTCNQKFSSTLNVHDARTVDEICEEVELSVVDSSSLTSAFTNVETICSRVSKVSMNFDSPIYSSEEDWGRSVGDFLAKFVSLATLHLSFNNCSGMGEGRMGGLWSGLAQNTSITTLSITVDNHSYMGGDWIGELGSSLAQNTSITTLSITVNSQRGMIKDLRGGLWCGFARNTSISTPSIIVNNYRYTSGDGMGELGSGLAQNTTITTLSITFKNHSLMSVYWMDELGRGLAQNTSITTLSITFNDYGDRSRDGIQSLGRDLAQNTTITTLSITFKNHSLMSVYWMDELGRGLAQNTSITTLSITFNNYGDRNRDGIQFLGSSLAHNTSITTLGITINNHSYMSGDWMGGLGSSLAHNTSITTLSITFNNHSLMSVYWMDELGRGLAQNTSITTLSITFNDYGDRSRDGIQSLGRDLAHNTSITTLSITFNNYSCKSGFRMGKLRIGLAQNTSITTLRITFDNFSDRSGDWAYQLVWGSAENTTITTLSITFNNYSCMSVHWMDQLRSDLAQNTSITTLSITFNDYGDRSRYGIQFLGRDLARNTSITTLSITFNNHSYMSGDWMSGLGSSLAHNTSITTLSITFNNYNYMSGDWMGGLGSGLAQNTSITTLSITVSNYSNMSGDWMGGLGSGLAQNTSITTLSITVNNHSDMRGDWMLNLRSVVAQNTSLAILNLTLNNHTDSYEDWINKLCQALSGNASSVKIFLEVNMLSESNEKP